MLLPENLLNPIMPDAVLYNEDPKNQATFTYKINYFIRSRPAKAITEAELTESFNSLATKPIWELYAGNHGTLPDCVVCHPSIHYGFRYGQVELNGLDNDITV